jgi:hypothetical protein
MVEAFFRPGGRPTGRPVAARRTSPGDLRPSWLHLLLRVDPRWQVHRQVQDANKRLTRKLKALRQEAWRLMHALLAEQHHWSSSVLRGHYGYFGMPHNWRSLNGFRQEVRRIWFNCLKQRSQKRRMAWAQTSATRRHRVETSGHITLRSVAVEVEQKLSLEALRNGLTRSIQILR